MNTPTPLLTTTITDVKNPFTTYVMHQGTINDGSETESPPSATMPIDYVDEIKLGLSRIEDLLRRQSTQTMKQKAKESMQLMQTQMETCLASLLNGKPDDLEASMELMRQRLELFHDQCRKAMQHHGAAKRTLNNLLHPVIRKKEEEEDFSMTAVTAAPDLPSRPRPRRNEFHGANGRFASPRYAQKRPRGIAAAAAAKKLEIRNRPQRKKRRRSLHYHQNTDVVTKLDYCEACHHNKILYRVGADAISDRGKTMFLCGVCSAKPANQTGELDKHMSRWSAIEENHLLRLVLKYADSFLCEEPSITIADMSKKISSVLGRSPAAVRKRMKSMKILLHTPGNPVLIHELSKRSLLKYCDDVTLTSAQLKPAMVGYDSDLTEDEEEEEEDDGDI